jgi:hypothetical protein
MVFDEIVFPFFWHASSVALHAPHAPSPVSIDQFADIAHAPILLSNHGAGTSRGTWTELLEDAAPSGADRFGNAHVDSPSDVYI